ncbi:hypothetical protein H5410_053021 [Solanum commersonii]|uniref:Uncharacterized protein n=1 Tax=Solanum commersonii TaxID=4109 RepID=A0A9J5X368_SOLCO|nr:hypothetical protein H5410_053021 [Solanum commersonii]
MEMLQRRRDGRLSQHAFGGQSRKRETIGALKICWQEWLIFSDIFFFLMKSGCVDFVEFVDKLVLRLQEVDQQILRTNHVTWLLAQIIRVELVMNALTTDSRKVETTRKILSFHKEEKSSDPNNPQSILLDFISSCQNLRIWTLNTATREYLNNEQLQKGKQIDEWWRQVNKGNHFIKLHGWLNKYVLPKTILQ